MQNAPARKNKSEIRTLTRAESVHACSLPVRRQILHLYSVYQGSCGYYREALRPVIRTLLGKLEART